MLTILDATFFTELLMLKFDGEVGLFSALALIGLVVAPSRFNRSRASISAPENCRRCLGLNGTGVDTLDVRNYFIIS